MKEEEKKDKEAVEAATTEGKKEAAKEKVKEKADIYKVRQRHAKIDPALAQQFANNRLLGKYIVNLIIIFSF